MLLNIYKSELLAEIIQQNLERKSVGQQPDYPQVTCCIILAGDLLSLHFWVCNFHASVRVCFLSFWFVTQSYTR